MSPRPATATKGDPVPNRAAGKSAGAKPHPARLSRAAILDAAVHLMDEEGPERLTLRRLGASLGVDATAVYRHFRDKDELILALADHLFGNMLAKQHAAKTWRLTLRHLVLGARAVYLAHPQFASRLAHSPETLPSLERVAEIGLRALRSSGLRDHDVAKMYWVLVDLVASSSVFADIDDEADRRLSAGWRRSYASLPQDEFPHCVDLAPLLFAPAQEQFEYALDLILDAIEARAAVVG